MRGEGCECASASVCECERACACACAFGARRGAEGGCADLKLGVANGSGANKADGSTH